MVGVLGLYFRPGVKLFESPKMKIKQSFPYWKTCLFWQTKPDRSYIYIFYDFFLHHLKKFWNYTCFNPFFSGRNPIFTKKNWRNWAWAWGISFLMAGKHASCPPPVACIRERCRIPGRLKNVLNMSSWWRSETRIRLSEQLASQVPQKNVDVKLQLS